MKIAIIKTNNTPFEQLDKIFDESNEFETELIKHCYLSSHNDLYGANETLKNLQLEALDILTAAFNLVNMLNIPNEVIKEHEEKMINYSQDPKRMYEIVKWVVIQDETNTIKS